MKKWDIFISHASEDKNAVAIPLARLLEEAGLKVWLDQHELTLGDSLRGKINEGLAQSRYGVVILSKAFLAKDWPVNELNSLLAMEEAGHKVMLPVCHEIERAELIAAAPLIADRLAARTSDGLDTVAKAILRVAQSETLGQAPSSAVRTAAFDLSHRQLEWYHLEDFTKSTKLRLMVVRGSGPGQFANPIEHSALVLALPYHCSLTPSEIAAIDRWVYQGGGLFVMGFYAADIHHQGSNPSALLRVFGLEFGEDVIMPAGKASDLDCRIQTTSRKADLAVTLQLSGDEHPITQGVKSLAFQSACSLKFAPGTVPEFLLSSPPSSQLMRAEGQKDPAGQMPVIAQWVLDRTQSLPLLVVCRYGKGRVVATGTWKLCTLDWGNNLRLVENIVDWLVREAPNGEPKQD